MAEIHSISMRHRDFAQEGGLPETVRIPRPLRDLLAASRHGVTGGCGVALNAASIAPGEWIAIDPAELVDVAKSRIAGLKLRARDGYIDVQLELPRQVRATAIARRAILIIPRIPHTAMLAAVGRPVSTLIDAPFFGDAAITVERIIERDGERQIDVRCRCPSHAVRLGKPGDQ